MDVDDLTPEQRQRLQEQVGRQLRYLGRLQRRMELRGWGGELYHAVVDAFDAVHALSVKLHYACCDASKREREQEQQQDPQPPPDEPPTRPAWMNSYGPSQPAEPTDSAGGGPQPPRG